MPVKKRIAASCNPQLIIADEFTTALDVTTQAQVLEMLKKMTLEGGHTSLAIVTHNLGMIARYAQRIYVMYAGRIIESGTVRQIFGNPLHLRPVNLMIYLLANIISAKEIRAKQGQLLGGLLHEADAD